MPWALTIDPLGFRRAAALQEGLRRAVAVPLALAETVASLWPGLQELVQCGNPACRSDLQVRERGLGLLLQGEQRGGSGDTHGASPDKSASQGALASLSQQSPLVYPVLRVGSKDFI